MQIPLRAAATTLIGAAALLLSLAVGAEAATAYITNEKGDSLTVIDVDKMEATRTVKVGQRPRGIALSRDGGELFICLGDEDTIAVLDAKTLKRIGDLRRVRILNSCG